MFEIRTFVFKNKFYNNIKLITNLYKNRSYVDYVSLIVNN